MILAALLGMAGYFGYVYREEVQAVVQQLEAKVLPCRYPISYSIGSIDKRFGVSTSSYAAALKEAEDIWEKPSGKDLFVHKTAQGDVRVNLVYDYRQETTNKMAAQGVQIKKNMSSYEALKARYDALALTVKAQEAHLTQSIAGYDNRQEAYNADVLKWNRKGGAPPAEYERLQAEDVALEAEAQRVEAEQAKFNEDIDMLNAYGTLLNRLIAQLNLNVEKYNQAGASVGAEFEEGVFESSASMQKIDIYEYSDHNGLVRVLAHELGHALGIEHVADSEAIMYKVNKGESMKLAEDDIAALNVVCTAGIFN